MSRKFMSFLNRGFKVKILLLIVFCLMAGVSNANEPQKPVVATQTESHLINREGLSGLGRALADCLDDNTPCKKTFGVAEIVIWLKDSKWRASGRRSNDKLNFDDFAALHKRYGNALASLSSYPDPLYGDNFKVWTLIGTWESALVIDHADLSGALVGIGQPNGPGDWTIHVPKIDNAIPTEIKIEEYAKELAILMDANDDGKLTVREFVEFMITRQR